MKFGEVAEPATSAMFLKEALPDTRSVAQLLSPGPNSEKLTVPVGLMVLVTVALS